MSYGVLGARFGQVIRDRGGHYQGVAVWGVRVGVTDQLVLGEGSYHILLSSVGVSVLIC